MATSEHFIVRVLVAHSYLSNTNAANNNNNTNNNNTEISLITQNMPFLYATEEINAHRRPIICFL